MEIKNRFTQNVMFVCECNTLKETVEKAISDGANLYGANLYGADLQGANLRGANLRGANLYGANLYGANLDGEKISKAPIQINNLHWPVLITEQYMRIGCQRHSHDEWKAFDNRAIAKMDGREALKFWRMWKDALLAMCAGHAAAGGSEQ